MKAIKTSLIISLFALSIFSCAEAEVETPVVEDVIENKVQEVTVYSHRHYPIDKEIYTAFEKETGIKVYVKEDKATRLIELIAQKNDEADILITVDVARLVQAKAKGIFQPIESETLTKRVPDFFRDTDNQWFGLTKRYRVVAYNKATVDTSKIQTYEDLAKEDLGYKIAVRSSDNTYNQSLLSYLISELGEEGAFTWSRGVVANMSRDPKGGDRDQVKEVAAGRADLAIINTYYLGKMLNSDVEEERLAGESVALMFPNKGGSGAHVNISGAGVCKNAPNKENAVKLIEYLLSDEVQAKYSAANHEYPMVDSVEPSKLLKSWGSFTEASFPLQTIGEINVLALDNFAAADWK